MTATTRTYSDLRSRLVLYLLEHDSTPAQAADWLEKDGRASPDEIRILRESETWTDAHLRTVPPLRIHPKFGKDYLWHQLTGRTELHEPPAGFAAHGWESANEF